MQSAKLVSPKRRCRRREASMRTRAVTAQASALNRVRRALKTMDPGRGRVRQSSSPKYPWPAVLCPCLTRPRCAYSRSRRMPLITTRRMHRG